MIFKKFFDEITQKNALKLHKYVNPQNKQISKPTLLFEFGQVEAEIIEFKDTRAQFQFSRFCAILRHFSV